MTPKYTGLTDAEVLASRERNGANVLTPPPGRSLWSRFLEKFRDPLIIILLCAGVLSVLISFYEFFGLHQGAAVFFEPVGIFVAVILATGLGFLLELKAEREFAVLNRVGDDTPVQVVRNDGNVCLVPRSEVVKGDIVLVNTGDEVPADGILLQSTAISVDESSLTGEPVCTKDADRSRADAAATYPTWMLMRGSKVMEGHGAMEVTAVGDSTENGRVYTAASIDSGVKTPLDNQLSRLSRMITIFSYVVGLAVIVGRMLTYFILDQSFEWMEFGAYFLQTIMIAVTLVVCSVPEGLPMAVTMSLAYSMRRMLHHNNLVRRLHACETMGAATVICTDKTGTLTQNRMQVAETAFFGNPPAAVIEEGIALNSTAALDYTQTPPQPIGNPTEGALLLWLESRGRDYRELKNRARVVAELPFTTERKFMATVVDTEIDGHPARVLYVKGAPEIVFGMCADHAGLTRTEIDAKLLDYQEQGMRTLGFAYAVGAPGDEMLAPQGIKSENLVFLGIAAISDPVRPDVPPAIHQVRRAGIDIKIVTGDTSATARQIARQIGLWTDADTDAAAITGPEFAAISDAELPARVAGLKIISRARPMDKKRLVQALQARGEVVAVTGDGTNDAPALKAAQVGLSMGDGTSVAKDSSDITIIDNSFASIGEAVMWGRSLYRNIQRFILFQVTVNVVACATILAGTLMGLQSPLTVIQILWVNLIMDTFAAVALASLPPNRSVMNERPRRNADFIVSPAMWRFIGGCGGILAAVLVCLLYVMHHVEIGSLTHLGGLRWMPGAHDMSPRELSMFFSVFVLMQFWNIFNARAFGTGRSAFHLRHCGPFVAIAAVILVGQILIVTFGGACFNTVPLTAGDWLVIIAGTSPVLLVGEIWRGLRTYFAKKH